MVDLVLDGSFIQNYLEDLGVSGGEIKFNVSEERGAFLISIPNAGKVNIDGFRGRTDLLQQ